MDIRSIQLIIENRAYILKKYPFINTDNLEDSKANFNNFHSKNESFSFIDKKSELLEAFEEWLKIENELFKSDGSFLTVFEWAYINKIEKVTQACLNLLDKWKILVLTHYSLLKDCLADSAKTAQKALKLIKGRDIEGLEGYKNNICTEKLSAFSFMSNIVDGKYDKSLKYLLETIVKNLKAAKKILDSELPSIPSELAEKRERFDEIVRILTEKGDLSDMYFKRAKMDFAEAYESRGLDLKKNFEAQMSERISSLFREGQPDKADKAGYDLLLTRNFVNAYRKYMCKYIGLILEAYAIIKQIEESISVKS